LNRINELYQYDFGIIGLMTNTKYPLSQQEFDVIYAKVPRLTLDIIVKNKDGKIYLTKRSNKVPCEGKWHLPGGTVFYGESLEQAIKRITRKELSIEVQSYINVGYIEYPSHYLNGLGTPVALVFEIIGYTGTPKIDEEAVAGDWFNSLPEDFHPDQDIFLIEKSYLKAS